MQALELSPVSLPCGASRRIRLNDLQAVIPSHKPNAVVIAEGIRRPGDELVQLDLSLHQGVEGTKVSKYADRIALASHPSS